MFSIQFYHSELNAAFYRQLLKDINVQFVLLPESIHLADDYNQFLKSKVFWDNFQPENKVLLFGTETIFLRSPDMSLFGTFALLIINNLHYHYAILDYDFTSAPIDSNYFKAAVQSRGGDIPLPEKKFYHDHPIDKFIYSSRLYTDDVVSVAALGIGAGLSLRSARSMQVSSTDLYN